MIKLPSIKKEFITIAIAIELLIIAYYGITLIATSFFINRAILFQDLNILITSNSWLPIFKIVNSLLDVQTFNQVGLIEIITASLLLIKGLSFIDMIFMINVLVIIFIMFFKENLLIEQKLGIYIIISFTSLSLVMLLISVIAALNSLLFSNQSPLTVLPLFSLLFLIFGISSLIGGLGANLYYFISKYQILRINKIGK
jgi:hypothetical protein